MSGNIWMYAHHIDDEDLEMLKRDFITYKMGVEYYGFGMKPFTRMVHEAGAVFKIGKMVRINRHIFEGYLRENRVKKKG